MVRHGVLYVLCCLLVDKPGCFTLYSSWHSRFRNVCVMLCFVERKLNPWSGCPVYGDAMRRGGRLLTAAARRGVGVSRLRLLLAVRRVVDGHDHAYSAEGVVRMANEITDRLRSGHADWYRGKKREAGSVSGIVRGRKMADKRNAVWKLFDGGMSPSTVVREHGEFGSRRTIYRYHKAWRDEREARRVAEVVQLARELGVAADLIERDRRTPAWKQEQQDIRDGADEEFQFRLAQLGMR